MTIVVPGSHSYFLGARARVVDDQKELAADNWFGEHIAANSALKWIVGRYVEADNPNQNRQMWTHADLAMAEPTIQYAPMNLLHDQRNIVGTFTNTSMMYPTEELAQEGANPWIEALGAFWKAYFPEELELVERAHAEGALFFSMECIGESVTFHTADFSETETFPFKGAFHESYGDWNKTEGAIRQIDNPHFLGGALILPPTQPGWKGAEITDIAKHVKDHADAAEAVYDGIEAEAPHLSSQQIEEVMLGFLQKGLESSDGNSIVSDQKTKGDLTGHDRGLSESDSEREGDTVTETTYTEAEFQAAVADALAPIRAELETLKASADAEAIEAKIAEIREAAEVQVAELEKKLDTAVLEAQAATEERDAVVAWLEAEAVATAEAAEIAARRDERLTQVKDVASFPAEYLEANAERWASMDTETFEALLADYAAASSAKSDEESEDKGSELDDALGETAMKASREGGTQKTMAATLSELRRVDLSTL